ncbi:MAG: TonB-dependent receptor plug domain-containing protein, partial [Bacteroidetes bacterium]|nr:TonB-dependent receptor plug domain-containing protein [Bacteroidota bacterium]
MKKQYIISIVFFVFMAFSQHSYAQSDTLDIESMTKEDVMALSYDQLLALPFEDLLQLADIVGVSLEELYELILNKDVVSASKKIESSFEAPLSTSVISYDEIVASGARNIEEALRLVPGMIVREKTSGNFDVHIRGNDNIPPRHMFLYSENSITLVMINGRPVYNYAHGGTFWETLPIGMEDIDRIEVVRGPSNALYGPNAASGVVNIITKDIIEPELKARVNAELGTQNNQRASLRLQKKVTPKLGLAVTGNFYHADRNTDKLYVHQTDEYVSKDVLDTLPDPKNPQYNIFDPNDDIDDMYPDPGLARENMGANAYVNYNISNNSFADLSAGLQYSDIISSTMGDNPTPTVGRESLTGYGDLRLKINDFQAQINYLDGWQDIVKQDTGFKMDIKTLNANAEYDFHVGDLNIRPGFAYQLAIYNDEPFLSETGQDGFFNGSKDIYSFAGSLRLDYTLFERLRLIAALRAEDYNTHDDMYFSYQFVAAYNLNDKHYFRAVHSRANRGPFFADNYANYLWDRDERPIPRYIDFQ